MNTTTFLAQMWGPAILAVALGVFFSRRYYIQIYRDLQKEALALLLFGMTAIAAGIAQIHFHNIWGTFPEIVISLLGWALLLKGLVMTMFPKLVDQVGDYEAKSNIIPFAGGLMLIVGLYLSWVGFFM